MNLYKVISFHYNLSLFYLSVFVIFLYIKTFIIIPNYFIIIILAHYISFHLIWIKTNTKSILKLKKFNKNQIKIKYNKKEMSLALRKQI